MSLINFDDSRRLTSEAFGSPLLERQHTKTLGKTKQLRLDSLTTIQACNELGILVEDLKPKNLEDFKSPNCDEGIPELRYNHYTKRYDQNLKDVMMRKRQLNRARMKSDRLSLPALDIDANGLKSATIFHGSNIPVSARAALNNTNGSNALKLSLLSPQASLPTPMLTTYNKTINYFRNSHETGETRGINDIVGNEMSTYGGDDMVTQFSSALAQEVSKFNKVKRQKQKEALDAYVEEMKRIKLVEELKEKEKRKEIRSRKLVAEKQKVDLEKKKKAEDKLEQLRENDKKYRMQKLDEKKRIQKKLDEHKKKLAEEVEERRRVLAEQEERLEQKKQRAEEVRGRLKEEEQARSDLLKSEIQSKIYRSEERYQRNMSEKSLRVTTQIQRIDENVKRMKSKQVQDSDEYVQKLVEKLVKKEESLQMFQKQHLVELKKREKEMGDKTERFLNHQSDIKKEYKDRMKDINERFQKVQENLEAKKVQNEKNMKLKQEFTRLKLQDKQENYNKKLRQTQYERQQIIERQKYNEAKIQWLKNQREILKQAKVEVSIQSKIEKERIDDAIIILGKLINESADNTQLTDNQKKLLKAVLTPEDYRNLENEEKRHLEEKREAEEQRKLGKSVSQGQLKQIAW